MKLDKRTAFTPKVGEVYENYGGRTFRCLAVIGLHKAIMQNTNSLWTFQANGCGMYEDGTIDWDYSTGGYFEKEEEAWKN